MFSRVSTPLRAINHNVARRSVTSQIYQFSTTSNKMAARSAPSPAEISETAQAEGGTVKGSQSAQMQSEIGKTRVSWIQSSFGA